MPQPARHPSSHLYPYELFGNTLVVRPHGDALGFSVHETRSEMGQVKELARDPRVRHLLVDLSAEHYYGSMVLGDLVEFGQLVKSRGGRIGLCGVSPDLATVLRMMHLDEQWEIFADTDAGLRAVAAIPLRQRLWRYRWAAVWLMAVGVAGVAYALWPATDRGAEYYAELSRIWRDYDQQRGKISVDEREWLRRQMRVKLEPIFADLSRRGKNQPLTEVEQSLLFATRRWREAMNLTGPDAELQHDKARFYLELAGVTLSRQSANVELLPLASIPPTPASASETEDTTATEESASTLSAHDAGN